MCFFAGGTRFSEQGFGVSACSEHACLVPFNPGYTSWLVAGAGAAKLDSSLLILGVIAVLLSAAFHNSVQSTASVYPLTNQQEGHYIISISHGVRRSLWCSILVN